MTSRKDMDLILVIYLAFLVLGYVDAKSTGIFPFKEHLTRIRRQAQNDNCIHNITIIDSGGTITTPGYPNNYPSNLDCRWLLTSLKPNATINLRINTLLIEPDTDCKLDFLQVYLGSNTLARPLGPFCGNINNRLLVTNSSQVLLLFHSDPVYADKGFSIEYYTRISGGCSVTLSGDSGTLQSPEYPKNYPDKSHCYYNITVSSEKQILLTFDFLELENYGKCEVDYVQIFDGSTQSSKLIAQVCQGAQEIKSSTNSLLLYFHSDETYNKKGFHARYEAIDLKILPKGNCLWKHDGVNGTVASPNYPGNYPELAECNIWLIAPKGYWIFITFDAFALEPADNCSSDYLQIREGSLPDSHIIGTYCDYNDEPKNLTSTTNKLQVIFHSDEDFQFSGFKFRYWFLTNKTDSKIEQSLKSVVERITFEAVPQNATIPVGSSYMIRCKTNQPNTKIRWWKENRLLSGRVHLSGLRLLSNNSLWIQSMDDHLTGVYTCDAASSTDTAKVQAFIAIDNDGNHMSSECSIVFRKAPKQGTFAEGENVKLECLASGEHVRTVWEKDGEPLRLKGHMILIRNELLYIDRITVEDAGVYTCRAYDEIINCQRKMSALVQVDKRIDIEKVCGKPRLGYPTEDVPHIDHGKIVGGQNAKKGAYPWQVMLWEPSIKSFCGGTLLNERWIATAAHCFKNYKNMRWDRIVIKLGKYDREQKEDQEFITGIADPSSIVIHPHYKLETFDNDLALVRLKDYVRFTDYILPICLVDEDIAKSLNNGSRMGTVTGWGKLKQFGPTPRYLQEIRLPIVDQNVCIASTTYRVSRNMFCAGYAQEIIGDACDGDSGGPFIMSHNDRWYLIGIVSWGEGCGMPNKYGYYTKIQQYLSWIKGTIKL